MRSEYLELIARHGLDVSYILTGQRGGDRLDQRESMLLSMFRALDDISQCTILLSGMRMAPEGAVHFTPAAVVEQIVAAVQGVGGVGPAAAGTVHESQPEFKAERDV
ncbi:hypothetical protein SBA_ch1_24130 [Sphingomonas bisphenolicum]|uniref:Resolvase/invertase-type recombinase catalytic domain-containing protein n=2 Tax=Sphingomonas bisphenolicum TaxID=296544 RepID=A0ABN5WJW1_9SPHN|nr:hypothetical protein SBA_ch1_24130 [Sphingomonas bisphenolicum]